MSIPIITAAPDTSLDSSKIKYLDLTHKLNEYNEIYNVNDYLKKTAGSEIVRLQSSLDNLRKFILQQQQRYLLEDYSLNDTYFRTNIIRWTGIVSSILLLIAATVASGKSGAVGITSNKTMFMMAGFIVVIYMIIVLAMARSQTERRKTAYQQFYWSGANPKTTSA